MYVGIYAYPGSLLPSGLSLVPSVLLAHLLEWWWGTEALDVVLPNQQEKTYRIFVPAVKAQ